ncbi:MAG: hypothetical protein ACI4SR_00845 [Faecalibacillus sp.]
MKIRSYEQVTDKSIIEIKMYLIMHSQGVYQQDIHDIMNASIDVYQLKRKLNKRHDIQLWLFSEIKKSIDDSQSYDEIENHLIMMNLLIDQYYKPLLEYKYNLFYYILKRKEFTIDIYCLLRHLIKYKAIKLDEFIKSITALKTISEYDYHHISSEILLLEKQYRHAYLHLPYIEFDQSLKKFEKALYNYSPYKFQRLIQSDDLSLQILPVR